MTLVSSHPDEPVRSHPGELRLRRLRLGELAGVEKDEAERHVEACARCRARLKAFDDEQRQFEQEIPLERFAGGVERARRVPRATPRRAWTVGLTGLAAAAGLVLMLRAGPVPEAPLSDHSGASGQPTGFNRTKSGGDAIVVIRSAEGQTREASPTEHLRPGDRLRLGYRLPSSSPLPSSSSSLSPPRGERVGVRGPRYLLALALDDHAVVTPLYPETGPALAVEPRPEITYLPDSVELTGAGAERLFLLLLDRPLEVSDAARHLHAAFTRAGSLDAVSLADLEGLTSETTWLFHKP